MLAQVFKRWDALRASYWFLPAVMTLAAIVSAFLTTRIDSALDMAWLDNVSWLHANTPEGARAMLSTIAGSMMTVAGVTFSVTIAAVAYTTSQFGPRLLGNFMRDRGNQITLGTFIATFIYCLMLLRTVYNQGDASFVPQIGVLGALGLALASIAVFIYFIHHVAESIHISNVIANIGRELSGKINDLPVIDTHAAQAAENSMPPTLGPDFAASAARLVARDNGYVQNLVDNHLLDAATEHDVVIRVERGIGEFVHRGETLALVWPAHHCEDAMLDSMYLAYALGRQRTISQDPMFLVHELIEIAGRALSPGVNDPFTAMSCMDWLRSTMVQIANCDAPSPYRHDENGALRLIVTPFSFEAMADRACHSLRPYFCKDPNACVHMLQALSRMASEVDASQCKQLLQHAQWLARASFDALPDAADQARINTALHAAEAVLKS